MTTHIEQVEEDARAEAERRHPSWHQMRAPGIIQRSHWGRGFEEGAIWQSTRPEPPVTEEEVEASARSMWRADDAEMDTSWTSSREFYMDTARAALEAARATREGKNQ